MNFNCVFPNCNFKENNIEEDDFILHLNENHEQEMLEISQKEDMSINAVIMITVSNSRVFINS